MAGLGRPRRSARRARRRRDRPQERPDAGLRSGRRRSRSRSSPRSALAGFAYLKQDDPDRFRLTPGLVQALRTNVPARDVVFSDLETSYRIEAYAPVYVSAAPPAHVADTKDNYPKKRRDDGHPTS